MSHFGRVINPDVIQKSDIVHVFSMVKKNVNKFRVFLVFKFAIKEENWESLRFEVTSFFEYVAIMHEKFTEDIQLVIAEETIDAMSFIGKISAISEVDPSYLFSIKNKKSASFNYLNLCMDVWWTSFNLLKNFVKRTGQINLIQGVNDPGEFDRFLMQCILNDLMALSFLPFILSSNQRALISTSPYVCENHKRLYTKLLELLEKDDNILTNVHPFWLYVNPTLMSLMEEGKNCQSMPEIVCTISRTPDLSYIDRDAELAILWFSSHLIELMNSPGEEKKWETCNSSLLTTAVSSILRKMESSESSAGKESLEMSLNFCIRICRFCDPCIDFLLPYTEFFKKPVTQPINKALVAYPRSSYAWCRKIEVIVQDGSLSNCDDKCFDLFLRLLAKSVAKLLTSSKRQCLSQWQKIKGRLCHQSLQPKKIEAMDCLNLFKFGSILVVLSYSSKDFFAEIGEKLDYIAKVILPKVKSDPQFLEKILIVVRAIFCAIYLQESGQNSNSLISPIESIFERVCGLISTADPSRTDKKFSLVTDFAVFYFEEISTLIEMKGDDIGSIELVPEKVQILLSKLMDRDLMAFIKAVRKFLTSVREAVLNSLDESCCHNYRNLINNVLTRFLPYVKAQFMNKNSQFDFCSIAEDLTYLVLVKEPGKMSTNEFREIFLYFSCSKNATSQGERYCNLIFQSEIAFLPKQLKSIFQDLLSRYALSDAHGQAIVQRIINKLISFIQRHDPSGCDAFIKSHLKKFTAQDFIRKSPMKFFSLLQMCSNCVPSIKAELVSDIAQRIREIENEQPIGTMDSLREAFVKFIHSDNP